MVRKLNIGLGTFNVKNPPSKCWTFSFLYWRISPPQKNKKEKEERIDLIYSEKDMVIKACANYEV